jgi:hypothetical protein
MPVLHANRKKREATMAWQLDVSRRHALSVQEISYRVPVVSTGGTRELYKTIEFLRKFV